MQNFDQFIGVDWSGAKAPIKTKSIALASLSKGKDNLKLHEEIRTRDMVADYIGRIIDGDKRTLIGIDCNFGYAADTVKKQIGLNATAPDLWARVDAVNQERPNFFAGDFWTHDDFKEDFWTEGKMQVGFQMPKRKTEIICAENGYGHPESPFKLIGAKQVGKGGLAGMRLVHQLKHRHGGNVAIYPFEPLHAYEKAKVVITEIYPRLFIMRAGMGYQKLRTKADLNTALAHYQIRAYGADNFSDHDADALISAAGLRHLCGDAQTISHAIMFPTSMNEQAKRCEGWIFGIENKRY